MTARAGVGDPGFSTSAVWFDYDNDGKLDLFVANYVDWSVEKDQFCSLDGKNKSYCTPQSYKGQSSTLYHNKGNGTFENVTQRAGSERSDAVNRSAWRCWITTATAGWICSLLTTQSPTSSTRTTATAPLRMKAVAAGVAFSEAGTARAGMGVDAGDYDGSGRPGIVLGNFTNESMALYQQRRQQACLLMKRPIPASAKCRHSR
mgnify:CR=1 FL=1